MQQFLDWDQIVYANNTYSALVPGRMPLLNPHHLHVETGSMVFHQFMSEYFGDAGFTDVMFNNRMKSLLFASIGIICAFLLLYRITGSILLSLAGTLLIGVSHGYLHYATKFDTPIYPAAIFIVTVFILEIYRHAVKKPVVWLLVIPTAFLLFAGVMAHQYMGLVCVLLCIAIALPPWLFNLPWKPAPFLLHRKKGVVPVLETSAPTRWAAAVSIAVLGIVFIVAGYFWAGKTMQNLPFHEDDPSVGRGVFRDSMFYQWLFLYETTSDLWGDGLEEFAPEAPLRGYTDAWVAQPGNVDRFNRNYSFAYNFRDFDSDTAVIHNIVGLITLITLFGCVIYFPILWGMYGRTFFLVFASFISFSLFTTYWEPYYFEFWLIPQISQVFLFIMLIDAVFTKLKKGISVNLKPLAAGIVLFFAFSLCAHNQYYYLLPYSRTKQLEGYSRDWDEGYYMPLYSDEVYRNPDNVYGSIYNTEPGSVFSRE
ncbi:MAG: hypothetical protein ACLFR1_02140 [Spirochaetia bacterium]